jgi:hypothetical protein
VFEAAAGSTGRYGITPEMIVSLFADAGYSISTMRRWLAGRPPLGGDWFCQN